MGARPGNLFQAEELGKVVQSAIIVTEILSVSLKTSQSVSCITIDNDEFLISQLADDTTLFLKNKESLGSAIDLIERF